MRVVPTVRKLLGAGLALAFAMGSPSLASPQGPSDGASTILARRNFESFSPSDTWVSGTIRRRLECIFTGYGKVAIGRDGSQVLYEEPQHSTSKNETHASLVRTVQTLGDMDMTIRVKTVEQLRTPTPNEWETAWILWHYTDNVHFYYLILKPEGWELGKEDPAYPGNQRYLLTGSETTYPVGRWYTVRIAQVGADISVWADGKLLGRFHDAERPYVNGSIAFYTEDATAIFDDLLVKSPVV